MADFNTIIHNGKQYSLEIPYSTEEHQVGICTDGKPIYRRVINITNINYGGTDDTIGKQIDFNFNVDKIIFLRGCIRNSVNNYTYPIPCYWSFKTDINFASLQYRKNDKQIWLFCSEHFKNGSAEIIVDYTKS